MHATPISVSDQFEIIALGDGRFAVSDLEESYAIQIRKDKSLTCTCRASSRYNQRCEHVAAVLTYVTQFHHLPEQAEIPEPLDVAQIEQEAINVYIVQLNRAHNVLTVQRVNALTPLSRRTKEFKHLRDRLKQIKLLKADTETIVAAMQALALAEDARDDAQLAMDIITTKMEDVKQATMRAQSVLKTLRP